MDRALPDTPRMVLRRIKAAVPCKSAGCWSYYGLPGFEVFRGCLGLTSTHHQIGCYPCRRSPGPVKNQAWDRTVPLT
jgi:hypothetical protein